MGLLMESWLAELMIVLSLPIIALYLWFSQTYKYWQKKGIPYLEPTFPFGNIYKSFLGKQTLGTDVTEAYRKLKGNRYGGMFFFNRPSLVLVDPDIIRNILVKDFWTFQDRGILVNEKEPLNRHLFLLGGNKWRRLRVKLTPTFTSGKMKMMFQTMLDCGREMADVLVEVADRGEVVEMREVLACFGTDVIASTAFGIECNSQRNPETTFRQWGRRMFEITDKTVINSIVNAVSPKLAAFLRLKSGLTDISQYFINMVSDTVKYREDNNVTRNDFMHLLIQLKNKGSIDSDKTGTEKENEEDNWKLSLNDVAAQAFVFFVAGFETSSTTMSFALHELAFNPGVQMKLQEEIDLTLKENGGDVSYDMINSMRYLDKVISETLRKYPPVPFLNRQSNSEYKLPDNNVVLDNGTDVLISVYGLHHDPEYFPDPERFDPERFREEEKAKRHPYVYLPFGEGPRICIGMRFGLMQTKVGLVYILSRFSVEPREKAAVCLELEPRSFVLKAKGGIQLRLTKRKLP